MTNALTVTTPNAFEKYGAAAANNALGTIARFTKFGEYAVGTEGAKLAVGTELVAIMPSLAIGFVHWIDGKPAEQQMGLVADGFIPPPRAELGTTDQSLWPRGE